MKGWHGDSYRHSLAARGIRTKQIEHQRMRSREISVKNFLNKGARDNLRFKEISDYLRIQEDFLGTKNKKLFISYLKIMISSSGDKNAQQLAKKLPREVPTVIAENRMRQLGVNPIHFRQVNKSFMESFDLDLIATIKKSKGNIEFDKIKPIGIKIGLSESFLSSPLIKSLVVNNILIKDYKIFERTKTKLASDTFAINFGRVWTAGIKEKGNKLKKDFKDAGIDFNEASRFLEANDIDPEAIRRIAPALHKHVNIDNQLKKLISERAEEGRRVKKQEKEEKAFVEKQEKALLEGKPLPVRKVIERRRVKA